MELKKILSTKSSSNKLPNAFTTFLPVQAPRENWTRMKMFIQNTKIFLSPNNILADSWRHGCIVTREDVRERKMTFNFLQQKQNIEQPIYYCTTCRNKLFSMKLISSIYIHACISLIYVNLDEKIMICDMQYYVTDFLN